jgi:hypothetical protein
MPTEKTESEVRQEASPFMKLSPELRLMVYQFALQDIVAHILSSDPNDATVPKPFRGALALLDTSRLLRSESCSLMKRIVGAHCDRLLDARKVLLDRSSEMAKATHLDMRALDQNFEQIEKLIHQHHCIDAVAEAIHQVFMFQREIDRARIGSPGSK